MFKFLLRVAPLHHQQLLRSAIAHIDGRGRCCSPFSHARSSQIAHKFASSVVFGVAFSFGAASIHTMSKIAKGAMDDFTAS